MEEYGFYEGKLMNGRGNRILLLILTTRFCTVCCYCSFAMSFVTQSSNKNRCVRYLFLCSDLHPVSLISLPTSLIFQSYMKTST